MESSSPPRVAHRRPGLRLLPLGLLILALWGAGSLWSPHSPAPAQAAGPATIAIDVDPATPGVQSSVSYPEGTDPIAVDVVILNGQDVGAFEFELIFNHVMLEFMDWQLGPYLGSSGRQVTCLMHLLENSVRIGCGTYGASPPGVSGDGLLGTIRFHPRFPGQTCLPLTLVETASILGDPFPTVIGPTGCVTIVPSTPTPTPVPTDTPIPSASPTGVPATARPSVTRTAPSGGTPAATHTAGAATASAIASQTASSANTPGPHESTATRGPATGTAAAMTAGPAATASPCPHSPEYWRTHPGDWPTEVLLLGTRGYTEDELLTVLALGEGDDASVTLARELIAAKLNAAAGIPAPDGAIEAGDDVLKAFQGKLPLQVAGASYQGQGMSWIAAVLVESNRRCGEAEAASDVNASLSGGGGSQSPSGLPGAGSRLPIDNSAARWLITVLSLLVGVLLVMLLRRSFDDKEEDPPTE